jgi:hypothetical protein
MPTAIRFSSSPSRIRRSSGGTSWAAASAAGWTNWASSACACLGWRLPSPSPSARSTPGTGRPFRPSPSSASGWNGKRRWSRTPRSTSRISASPGPTSGPSPFTTASKMPSILAPPTAPRRSAPPISAAFGATGICWTGSFAPPTTGSPFSAGIAPSSSPRTTRRPSSCASPARCASRPFPRAPTGSAPSCGRASRARRRPSSASSSSATTSSGTPLPIRSRRRPSPPAPGSAPATSASPPNARRSPGGRKRRGAPRSASSTPRDAPPASRSPRATGASSSPGSTRSTPAKRRSRSTSRPFPPARTP